MLSRNFRLQKVGDISWLEKNYNFSKIAFSIDELIIIDVSRDDRDHSRFCEHVKQLNGCCFVPIAAGGGVDNLTYASDLFKYGADKIIMNSSLYDNPELCKEIVANYGKQCLIASVDVIKFGSRFNVRINNGNKDIEFGLSEWIEKLVDMSVGEIYLNSIDRDGTGQGYLFELLDNIPTNIPVPLIMSGGAGNQKHLIDGLEDTRIDAVATAHLFNFVNDGLRLARESIINNGFDLPSWDIDFASKLKTVISD
jgi:cyclase